MATTEIGIDFIQTQVDHCDSIVANIDKIVPKLYKIRQQALAQKEYINDVNRIIISNYNTGMTVTSDKSITLNNPVSFSADTIISSNVTTLGVDSRKIMQSLFKFKHDIGTTTHFTTEQKGSANERTKGFNLSDVVEITTGLDNLLKKDSTTASAINDGTLGVTTLFKKLPDPNPSIEPSSDTAIKLVDTARGANTYEREGTTGVKSGLEETLTATDAILGFGLT
jgi:hypothetical protein